MTTFRTVAELEAAGLVDAARAAALEPVAARYAVGVTPAVATLIDKADADDPIARQFVPDPAELVRHPSDRADPIGDDAHSPVEGIVHRYPDRVLLKLVYTCPVYCRFCFRREMVGPKGRPGLTARQRRAAYDYIRAHTAIWEVILTGGDPLVLPPSRLRDVVAALAAIDHVEVLRIHT
ncbi:MAG: lysine 2,3-aminomutase, partial [Xanthobacteraceae bacterium]|nr:lysine 2,3-aminomutase [Xanthobacteraceae bacterium]